MQQRGGKLALHPLSQAQPAHWFLQQIAKVKQRDQLIQRFAELLIRNLVDRLIDQKRIHSRDVPHELVAIPHYQADAPEISVFAPGGDVPQDPRFAARWMKQSGEHLERGGLACAVWAQEADDLPFFHAEGYLLDGAN